LKFAKLKLTLSYYTKLTTLARQVPHYCIEIYQCEWLSAVITKAVTPVSTILMAVAGSASCIQLICTQQVWHGCAPQHLELFLVWRGDF